MYPKRCYRYNLGRSELTFSVYRTRLFLIPSSRFFARALADSRLESAAFLIASLPEFRLVDVDAASDGEDEEAAVSLALI